MSAALLITAAALWGAAAGALLPRAAYRLSVPSEEDWRERCPGGHPIRGWLGRARCARCPADTASYGPGGALLGSALLAAVTAVLCGALAAVTGARPELGVWLAAVPVGVLLAVVDLRVRRLPDVLTLPLGAAVVLLLGVAALLPGHAGDWPTALLAALALGTGYFVLFLVNPAGMGFGDVKLALAAGAALGWYGWSGVLFGTFAGFLLGALYGGALVVVRKAGRKTAIPFGPFLLAGAWAGLLVGAA
ncbi:peptidase A24 [Streptomyces sp. AS58]|uniref:Prepilin peptidase n=1 Tax=Streptomyces cadmiisoli TaxID=2184053 RepID=A0A2Z4IZ40_9ACTN|nr:MULTISPECIES: A24 family peptidase [Streptomyces]AWW38211.1 prepilin peptidase [Streptomyces cadmiisoli]KOV59971.1 peptidase A24 [Streptomyces sp. AS58]